MLCGHATLATRVEIVCQALVSICLVIGVGVGNGVSSTIDTIVLRSEQSTTHTQTALCPKIEETKI